MKKTLIQCDFDLTVTDSDVSLLILDEFAEGDWRSLWDLYNKDKISLGEFNERAFRMVKAGRAEMSEFIKNRFKVRTGFPQFLNFCKKKEFRVVIVSNGLDFYIEDILNGLGWNEVEFHAAETTFDPTGLKVRYVAHNGMELDNNFKLSYTDLFLQQGYRIAYVGDGNSDFVPAQKCQCIFATESLLKHCQTNKVACIPFSNFNDVISGLGSW